MRIRILSPSMGHREIANATRAEAVQIFEMAQQRGRHVVLQEKKPIQRASDISDEGELVIVPQISGGED